MRKVLLMALVCAMLTSWSAVGHPVSRKAAPKERVLTAAEEEAETQEATPVPGEKANDSKTAGEQKEPAPEPRKAEPPVPAVKESEGTGPVAAFWFVLPGR